MSLSAAYSMKKRGKKSDGGRPDNEKGVHQESHSYGSTSSSGAGDLIRSGAYKASGNMSMGGRKSQMQAGVKDEHKRVLSEARSMPGPTSGVSGFAKGGEVSDHEKDADMIARIMHKRKEYSEGGMVANDIGVAEADELPAEYDDLVLRDELDGSQPEDSNEHGDDLPEDMVSRVMLKKKEKMPRPA